MFMYVPVVMAGWDGGNQAESDWLGARSLSIDELGAEPYVAVLLGGSSSHLQFMGGFDTSAVSAADIRRAGAHGQWLLDYANDPELGKESGEGIAASRRCLADVFREEVERQPQTVFLHVQELDTSGRAVHSIVRLCIWVLPTGLRCVYFELGRCC